MNVFFTMKLETDSHEKEFEICSDINRAHARGNDPSLILLTEISCSVIVFHDNLSKNSPGSSDVM